MFFKESIEQKLKLSIIFFLMCISFTNAQTQDSFLPYNTQGDNLVHIETADFDNTGAKNYVVGMTVEGKIIAYNPALSDTDPSFRMWEFDTGVFNIEIKAGEADQTSLGDEILVPGTDGHLRILSSQGALLKDISLGNGALYSVDVGVNSLGETIIVAGGVNKQIKFIDEQGVILYTATPPSAGVIRDITIGNYDGIGGDEVIVFYSNKAFRGSSYFEVLDLDTYTEPAYWGATTKNEDDVYKLGWTDKQYTEAYDMDGDGDDELVGHWGVMHPELGAQTQVLTTIINSGESLHRISHYNNRAEFTQTNKYIGQRGIPGNFKDGTGFLDTEMVTVYGDDLYLLRYDTTKSVDTNRFRYADYTYAHTMYHFSDGARLENSSGGLDKMVLCGPPNGDDHFYVVDLSGTDWKEQAKTIDGRGVLGDVRNTLETLKNNVESFSGTVAEGDPIRYLRRYGFLGWEMTPANIAAQADQRVIDIQVWKDELGGNPQKVKFYVDLKSRIIGNEAPGNQTPEGMVEYVRALAQRGVYSCLNIGHGGIPSVSPETVADCYEASIIDGEVYMMARTLELISISDYSDYIPHFEAAFQRAQSISATPPWIMMSAKGAYLTALSDTQGSDFFDRYKELFVAGIEESNVRMPEWGLSERVGLWLNKDIKAWSGEMIGDNITPNRVAEWSDMRNAHIVLRAMLTRYSLGATVVTVAQVIKKDLKSPKCTFIMCHFFI